MFLLSSLSVVWLPLGSKTAEQITLDIFQNCDVPEEESLTFDPEVDLNDDAVGKARYERFFLFAAGENATETQSSKTFARAHAVEWGAFEA